VWQNFLVLFEQVDRGGAGAGVEDGYNGNLFKHDPEVDDLELDDDPWTRGFKHFGEYDFSEEVNVEVLGHLFERSITELEKLRIGGLFALMAAADPPRASGNGVQSRKNEKQTPKLTSVNEVPVVSKMPKSAQRKR